jgi:formylmethanofuran dehydrogenase subunit B
VEHVTCLGCGCACDDIDVHVRDGRIVEARQACELGIAWFGDGRVPARSLVDGRDVTPDAALDAAADLLATASRPLVYLAPDLSCEGQRHGVALADRLRATLDSVTSATAMGSILAAQERGRASATLGEIRHRADLVVFWGVDPALRYPRFCSRYAPLPAGIHLPNGRRSRIVVAVDIGDARGPADADVRVTLAASAEIDSLTALAAAVAGAAHVDSGPIDGVTADSAATGSAPADGARIDSMPLQQLAERFRHSTYAAIVVDAEGGRRIDSNRSSALIALVQAVNGPSRGALSVLRAGGNRSGADAVMTAQTGYPAAVDFSRGYPRYRPLDGGALARLERREVDAVVILGAAARIPAHVLELLMPIRAAVVGPRASDSVFAASRAVVDTGVAGVHDEGTALRMDDVPVRLRRVLNGAPPAAPYVRALVERLTKTDAVDASARRIALNSRRARSAGTPPGSTN